MVAAGWARRFLWQAPVVEAPAVAVMAGRPGRRALAAGLGHAGRPASAGPAAAGDTAPPPRPLATTGEAGRAARRRRPPPERRRRSTRRGRLRARARGRNPRRR